MKWIKASERMPEKEGNYFIKVKGIEYQEDETVEYECGTYLHFVNTFQGKYFPALSKNETVVEWLDESSPSDNTQIRDGWVRVQDGLPPLVEGQDYSENVIAWLDGERKIMNYAILPDDYNNLCYAWCMVYNGLDGDAEFDDNYYPSHWQPLPTPPNH